MTEEDIRHLQAKELVSKLQEFGLLAQPDIKATKERLDLATYVVDKAFRWSRSPYVRSESIAQSLASMSLSVEGCPPGMMENSVLNLLLLGGLSTTPAPVDTGPPSVGALLLLLASNPLRKWRVSLHSPATGTRETFMVVLSESTSKSAYMGKRVEEAFAMALSGEIEECEVRNEGESDEDRTALDKYVGDLRVMLARMGTQ